MPCLRAAVEVGGLTMYGIMTGITDTDDINYCPKCGAEIVTAHGDGTAECDECGYHFGVIECEEDQ